MYVNISTHKAVFPHMLGLFYYIIIILPQTNNMGRMEARCLHEVQPRKDVHDQLF